MINNPNWCDGCTPENCPGCSEGRQEQDELMEQARLLGISAEREMALRARVQELERLADLAAARERAACAAHYLNYAPPSPTLGVAHSGPGTSAAAPKAAPAPAAVAGDPSWEALYYAWRKVGADVVGLDWGAFTRAVHYAPTTQAAPAAVAVPDGWKHDCAALLTNDVELWVDSCPHCGKPRAAAPQPPACQTCNDIGMIGGPSYYAPDEGGVPCPDCSAPQPPVAVQEPGAFALRWPSAAPPEPVLHIYNETILRKV